MYQNQTPQKEDPTLTSGHHTSSTAPEKKPGFILLSRPKTTETGDHSKQDGTSYPHEQSERLSYSEQQQQQHHQQQQQQHLLYQQHLYQQHMLQQQSNHHPIKPQNNNYNNNNYNHANIYNNNINTNSYNQNINNQSGQINDFLLQVLNHPRDRLLVLRLDKEIETFIKNPKVMKLTFPQMDSYQRRIVHQVAAYFKLDHAVVGPNGPKRALVLFKKDISCIPILRFSDMIEEEEPAKNVKILTRQERDQAAAAKKAAAQRKAETEAAAAVPTIAKRPATTLSTPPKSLEQREEDYAKARARIFQGMEESSLDELIQLETGAPPPPSLDVSSRAKELTTPESRAALESSSNNNNSNSNNNNNNSTNNDSNNVQSSGGHIDSCVDATSTKNNASANISDSAVNEVNNSVSNNSENKPVATTEPKNNNSSSNNNNTNTNTNTNTNIIKQGNKNNSSVHEHANKGTEHSGTQEHSHTHPAEPTGAPLRESHPPPSSWASPGSGVHHHQPTTHLEGALSRPDSPSASVGYSSQPGAHPSRYAPPPPHSMIYSEYPAPHSPNVNVMNYTNTNGGVMPGQEPYGYHMHKHPHSEHAAMYPQNPAYGHPPPDQRGYYYQPHPNMPPSQPNMMPHNAGGPYYYSGRPASPVHGPDYDRPKPKVNQLYDPPPFAGNGGGYSHSVPLSPQAYPLDAQFYRQMNLQDSRRKPDFTSSPTHPSHYGATQPAASAPAISHILTVRSVTGDDVATNDSRLVPLRNASSALKLLEDGTLVAIFKNSALAKQTIETVVLDPSLVLSYFSLAG